MGARTLLVNWIPRIRELGTDLYGDLYRGMYVNSGSISMGALIEQNKDSE